MEGEKRDLLCSYFDGSLGAGDFLAEVSVCGDSEGVEVSVASVGGIHVYNGESVGGEGKGVAENTQRHSNDDNVTTPRV
jgi:hypothetical protein